MSRRALFVPAALAIALLTGCGAHHKAARLHHGMTKHEVRAAWGNPDQVTYIPYPTAGSTDEGFEECWNYGIKRLPKSAFSQLCFWNGRLTSVVRY